MSVTDKKLGVEPKKVYVKSAIYLKCISCLILLQFNAAYATTPAKDTPPEQGKAKFLNFFRGDQSDRDVDVAAQKTDHVATEPDQAAQFRYIDPQLQPALGNSLFKTKSNVAKQNNIPTNTGFTADVDQIEKPKLLVSERSTRSTAQNSVPSRPQKVWQKLFPTSGTRLNHLAPYTAATPKQSQSSTPVLAPMAASADLSDAIATELQNTHLAQHKSEIPQTTKPETTKPQTTKPEVTKPKAIQSQSVSTEILSANTPMTQANKATASNNSNLKQQNPGLWQRLFPRANPVNEALAPSSVRVEASNQTVSENAAKRTKPIKKNWLDTPVPALPKAETAERMTSLNSQVTPAEDRLKNPQQPSIWQRLFPSSTVTTSVADPLTVPSVKALEPTKTSTFSPSTAASSLATSHQKTLWQRLFPSSTKPQVGLMPQNLNTQNTVAASAVLRSSVAEASEKDSTRSSTADLVRPLVQQSVASSDADFAVQQDFKLATKSTASPSRFWQRWFGKGQSDQVTQAPTNDVELQLKPTIQVKSPEPEHSVNRPMLVATTPSKPRKTLWETLFPKSTAVQSQPEKTPVVELKPELAIRRDLETAAETLIPAQPAAPLPTKPAKSWWRMPFVQAKSASDVMMIDQAPTVQPTRPATTAAKAAAAETATPVLSGQSSDSIAANKPTLWQRMFPSSANKKVDQVAALPLQTVSTTPVTTATTAAVVVQSGSVPSVTTSASTTSTTSTTSTAQARKSLWQILFPSSVVSTPNVSSEHTPSSAHRVSPIADAGTVSTQTTNLATLTTATLTTMPAKAVANVESESNAASKAQAVDPNDSVKPLNVNVDVNTAIAQGRISAPVNTVQSDDKLPTQNSAAQSASRLASTEMKANNRDSVATARQPKSLSAVVSKPEFIDYTVLSDNSQNQSWQLAPKSGATAASDRNFDQTYNNWRIEPRPSLSERVWEQTKGITGLLAPQPNDNFRYLDVQKLSNFSFEQPNNDAASVAPVQLAPSAFDAQPNSVTMRDATGQYDVSQSQLMLQPRMTIAEAVRIAVLRHPQITQSISQLASQNANIDIAKSQFYPQLSTGIATGDLTSSDRNTQQLRLNLQQALFDFGKIRTNVNTEQAKLQVQQANVLLNIDDIAFKVASAVININRFKATTEIAQQQVDGTRRILDIAKLRAKAGISSQADPVQAQTFLESAQSNLIAQQSLLRENQLRLRTLAGVDLSRKDFEIPDDLVQVSDLYKEPEFNKIPSMIVAQSQVEVAKFQRKQTQLNRYPTFLVRGSVSQSLNGRNLDNNLNDSTSSAVLLEATSNFFQGGLDGSQIKAASFAEQAAKAEVNRVYLDVLENLRTFREQIENKQEQIKVLVERQQSTIRTRELYQEQYKLGTRTVLDLLNAEQAIHVSNTELQNARFDIYNNLIQYIATTGKSRDAYELNSLTIQGVEIQP